MILKLTDQASPALERVADAADDAAEGAENAGGQFKITGATLAKFGASALAAGAAVGVLIKALADSKNELTAASIQTGLTANTLAGLRLAAEGSGLALDALTGGLVDLPKRMDEANRETGEALIAFKRLGIEVANADGSLRSVDSVLSESVEKLSGVANAAERSALSTILFGGAGANLMQALGGNELEEFVDQAERFGVTVGPEAAKAAGDFQRELAQTSMVAEKSAEVFLSAFGTGPGGASTVMKAFGSLLIGLSSAFKSIMNITRDFVGGFTNVIGDVLGELINLGTVIKKVMGGDFAAAADLAEGSLRRIAESTKENAAQSAGAVFDLFSQKAIRDGISAGAAAFSTSTAGTGGGVQRQVTQLTAAEEPGAGEDLAKQREADRKAREKEAKEQQKAFDQMRKDMEKTAREMEGLVRMFEELPAKIAEGFAGALSDPGSALASSLGPSGAILTTLSDLGAKNPKEIAKQFRSFFRNIVRALVKVIPELLATLPEILARNIPFLIEGIIKALPRIVEAFVIKLPIAFAKGLARWFVSALKKIKRAFGLDAGRLTERSERGRRARVGLGGGAAAGAAAGSLLGPVGTAAGAIVGSVIGLLGSKQTGGFVQSTGFQYLHAGERVVPPTGASTSSMMQAAGNIGGGQTINIHTNVVDPNSIRQLGILLNREFGNKGRTQGLSIFNNANPLAGAV
tara:strand:+ start:567 stop:2642 length:2076 start_codon:yes stop_codon:yes gene_type:complete